MQKAKVFAIEGSNIELIGTDADLKARLEAARTAEEWKHAGQKDGLEIWRVRNFKLIEVPPQQHGTFYTGDSYVVLRTRCVADQKKYDIHFWLGSETSLDEAGTAAYKTVELDDYFGGKPVEHREIQDYESALFQSYFRKGIHVLEGGYESGFNHVTEVEYKPRLLQVKGRRNNIRVTQIPLTFKSMNEGDVFILDAGLTLYQWNGSQSGPFERAKAGEVCAEIDSERSGRASIVVIDSRQDDHPEFWDLLGGKGGIKSAQEGGSDGDAHKSFKQLFRVSDTSGTVKVEHVASGSLKLSMLDPSDVFVLDSGIETFVWLGSGATNREKSSAIPKTQKYLKVQNRPAVTPITKVHQHHESDEFLALFD